MAELFFEIPYHVKDEVKKINTTPVTWCKERKKWKHVMTHPDEIIDPVLIQYLVNYIKVPYYKKDEVKANGGKWDAHAKSWYWVTDPNNYFSTRFRSNNT